MLDRALELAAHFGSRTKESVAAIKRSVYFGGSMSLEDGLHVERTEFLRQALSKDGQRLMLEYMADDRGHRRAAALRPATRYEQALAEGSRAPAPLQTTRRRPTMTTRTPSPGTTSASRPATATCAGWLYLPDGVTAPPVVVLGHGLGATREMRLDAFAERFAQAGIAALAFTYRHFGDSGGTPRQLLSIKRQLADWDAALAHVQDQVGRRPHADRRVGQLLRRWPRHHRRLAPSRAAGGGVRNARSPTASPPRSRSARGASLKVLPCSLATSVAARTRAAPVDDPARCAARRPRP